METLISLYSTIPEVLKGIGLLVAGASVLANLTPSQRDDKALSKIAAVLDVLALNINVQKVRRTW